MQFSLLAIASTFGQYLLSFFFQPLVLVLVVSLAVALVRGGRLSRLSELTSLQKWELIFGAFAIQYVLAILGHKGSATLVSVGPLLHVISYVILLIVVWYNRHLNGFFIIGLGIFLNFVVILANGGSMPVSVEGAIRAGLQDMLPLLRSETYVLHSVLTEQTRLKFLADVIVLPPPYPRPKVLSLGDVVMAVGLFIFTQHWVPKSTPRKMYVKNKGR